jgi:RNA-binding protein
LTTTVHDGQLLVDEAGRKIAKVSEMIGPVDAPYASATPLTNNIQKYIGKKIFMERESPAVRPKRFRGKR